MLKSGCSQAFTLIELLVVLSIIALLVSVLISRLGNSSIQAQMQNEIHQLVANDRFLRDNSAKNLRKCSLILDIGTGEYRFSFGDSQSLERRLKMTRETILNRFLSQTEDIRYGTAQIDYSPHGTSETFAIELLARQKSVWLLFSGISGQVTQFEEYKDVEPIFQSLQTFSIDAD